MTGKKVAIIGAGAAGVCTAKYMLGAGFDVTVFEAGSYVGGLWVYENDNGRSQAYRNLSIISSRRYTEFSDFPFDPQTPRFPRHWDMHRYLTSYAENFGVMSKIKFHTLITRVDPIKSLPGDGGRWRVTAEDGTAEDYDAVIVATGHLSEPSHSETLRAQFTGEYLHSSEYREPSRFAGRRVCIVGAGNSGADIASDICTVAARTVISLRSGVVIQPKVIAGMPFTDISLHLLDRRWIPRWIRAKVVAALIYLAHGDQERLGIPRPKMQSRPTLSESIIMDIEYNRVYPKPDIVGIDGRVITFGDGTCEEFDVVVGATGYRVYLPFIDPEIVPVIGNHVDLYKRIFVPDWPGIYFVGMLSPFSTLNRIFEEQGKVIIQAISGNVVLPPASVMRSEIASRNAVRKRLYTDSPRNELQEPDFGYVDDLRALLKPARKGRFSFLAAASSKSARSPAAPARRRAQRIP
jgi:dimethylaniline monooxygenase (N-oxide forming)